MLKWMQSGLSVVAGTAEPEYGREAIHPVTDFIKQQGQAVSRATVLEDFAWKHPNYTNVETQTFYFTDLQSGYIGLAQVIHSNLMGIKTTAQFTFRLYNSKLGAADPNCVWTSTALENFRTDGANFYADNLSIENSGANNDTYTLKLAVTEDSVVDLVVTRIVPGVVFGADGTTFYGDSLDEPWGSMRHAFWPRCAVTGIIKLKAATVEISGYTMFVMALQGMKPHHAAKSWNFLNFQSEHYSAVQMEFTTPKSYATTKVNVAILTSDTEILATSIDNDVVHENAEVDEVGWSVPKSITFNFSEGTSAAPVATVSGALSQLVERVDVMAEIPQFVKNIVSGVAGAKPYIYQFCNTLTIKHGDDSEDGVAFNEATFISE
ncbi:oxidative stress survival, Svf1-like protein [Metschnikowia bicuspidata var. bicuspidata NRRL YB-4993]|uniref:Oxidative stress survival, Svf1-like protein n=1 Tax=Metschnikowia bicuspidata var. bicuspidata NRRL YB-4993 TaxID=869754 RepID=A0A1A0HCP1_9ASCO|nr:oxidative stress survival, Svf1-like protein [Metschnikowia bicuspidata var. bicuspidata NRRL YB-4993]OBA21662.1 oxidative stress survival, Svf1-like protein [Metschnikowia bicuspidata var. bicuspidata NRRL YB-4993]